MKKIRFVVFASIALALILGSFGLIPSAQKSVAGAPATQSAVKAFSIPAISPFLFSAAAPVQVVLVDGASAEYTPEYACRLLSQTPPDWKVMKSRQSFDVTWVLKNTGLRVWGVHGVDVKYRGDTRMHTRVPDRFDIPYKVGPGQRFVMSLDMLAPKLPGYYVSNWGLYVGSKVFCKFYIVIYV